MSKKVDEDTDPVNVIEKPPLTLDAIVDNQAEEALIHSTKVIELGEYGVPHENADIVFSAHRLQKDIVEVSVHLVIVLHNDDDADGKVQETVHLESDVQNDLLKQG